MRTWIRLLTAFTVFYLSVMTTYAQDDAEKMTPPKVGEAAPTFVLQSLDGKSKTDLAAFRGDRPVVLFFGSYS